MQIEKEVTLTLTAVEIEAICNAMPRYDITCTKALRDISPEEDEESFEESVRLKNLKDACSNVFQKFWKIGKEEFNNPDDPDNDFL